MKNIFFLLLIIGFLGACTNVVDSSRLHNIERMQSQVDSSKVEYKTINAEKIRTYLEEAEGQLAFLEKHYTDTSDFENAKYIAVYNSNKKLMSKLLKGHDRLGKEIIFSQSQLQKLHHDVSNSLLSDSTYTQYADGEALAISTITNTITTLKDWETRTVNRFNGMHLPIDSVILELNNRGIR